MKIEDVVLCLECDEVYDITKYNKCPVCGEGNYFVIAKILPPKKRIKNGKELKHEAFGNQCKDECHSRT